MASQRVEIRQQSRAQQWVGRLAVGWSSGFVFLAVCLIPNMENPKFQRWIGPLMAVCFGAPTLAIVASRFTVDLAVDYNEGYNQCLKDLQSTPTNDSLPQSSIPQLLEPLPSVAANPPGLRVVPTPGALPANAPVSAPVHAGDDLSFLDAQIG